MPLHNPTKLDFQGLKRMDGNLFGLPARSGMALKHPDGKNAPTARRLRAVMALLRCRTQEEFANKLKVEKKRLNNALVGYPISIEIAQKVKLALSGLTRDWLYDGDEGGLPVSLRDELRERLTKLSAGAERA